MPSQKQKENRNSGDDDSHRNVLLAANSTSTG
jgi:hypothetical protein